MNYKRRRKRRCIFCHKLFTEEPELKDKQYVCSNSKCQAERCRRNARRWRKNNPEFQATHRLDDSYRMKHRKWKKHYRRNHLNYVTRNQFYWRKWKLKQSPSYRGNENYKEISKAYAP